MQKRELPPEQDRRRNEPPSNQLRRSQKTQGQHEPRQKKMRKKKRRKQKSKREQASFSLQRVNAHTITSHRINIVLVVICSFNECHKYTDHTICTALSLAAIFTCLSIAALMSHKPPYPRGEYYITVVPSICSTDCSVDHS